MVKKILSFLNKEFHGVNEAALLLGGFAFLSQILGLIRDKAFAHFVGAGPVLDVYYAAFRIPDLLYISVASLASVTVLMPFLVEKINKDRDDARRFLNNVFSVFMMFMFLISILIAIFMPYIAKFIAPGFNSEQMVLLITTSRIMLFSPIFIGLSNLIGTVTQLYKNFLIFSLSPIFYNLGILFGVLFLYKKIGVYGLALGVILGAFMHLGVQIPIVVKYNFFPNFIKKINWNEIWKVVKMSLPRTLALSANSLAFMALISMASTLKAGSISLFTFAYNLQSVPVGIIGISYSVAAFPILVKTFSAKDIDNFMLHITSAAKQIIFWSLPVIALLVVLRAQIVRVILGSGSFSWADTRLTAASVALFVISLVTQSLVLLLVRGYYASGNTKKPLYINVSSSIMIVVFAYSFIYLFKHYPYILMNLENLLRVSDVPGTMMLVLPISYAFGSILNFILIWFMFRKDFLKGKSFGIADTFMNSLISALVMGVVAYLFLGIFDNIFKVDTLLGIFLQGFLSGIIAIIFGVSVLYLLKSKEMEDIIKTLSEKLRYNRIVAPEQGEL